MMSVLLITANACSNTRGTERANPDAAQNEPMRKKNQADEVPTSGHQNDQIRENNR